MYPAPLRTAMALLLKKTVLYHPGRTGGHWVKALVRQAGLIHGESARLHDSPEDLRHWPEAASRPWSIAFVRHPLTWTRSFWIHETHFGWTNDLLHPPNEFSTFPEYLEYLIDAFPGGAVKRYFAPFIDSVNLIGRFEALGTELFRVLTVAAEIGPTMPVAVPPPINRSPDDIVSASAKGPRSLLERFLANETDYCRRFGYEGIPEHCLADDLDCQRKWFPVLSSIKGGAPEDNGPAPDNTFVFSDGTVWRGRPEYRRWQLSIWDALGRSRRTGNGGFLELGCGDGFFVFLAEELGYRPCYGVDAYRRSTTVAASSRLDSKAEFVQASMFARLDHELASTLLIRGLLNHTPWPHLLLLNANQMLAPGGEIIIGSVIIETDPDPGLCFSNFADAALFPESCPMIMSRTYLSNLVSQCGLVVDEICSEYDEISDKQGLIDGLSKVLHCPREGLLRRVVWKLRVAEERAESAELAWWLRSEPCFLRDCSSIDLNKAACRTIDQLTTENTRLKSEIERLTLALDDREADLRRERHDAALRNAELADRTTRLEQALADLKTVGTATLPT